MTIAEILSNEELRRHEFPVTREKIFLAHAAVCPLPRRVAEAMRDYALESTLGDQEETDAAGAHPAGARQLAARLLQRKAGGNRVCRPDFAGLELCRQRAALAQGRQYSGLFRRLSLQRLSLDGAGGKGRRGRACSTSANTGASAAVDVIGQVDEQTRLVALASNHFVAGCRLELEAIGKALRERNILFCVDGIQTLGRISHRRRAL